MLFSFKFFKKKLHFSGHYISSIKGKLRKKKIFLYVFPDVEIWMFICILAFYYVG